MTDQEIRQLLAAIMAYDNRKPSDAALLAWGEVAARGRWTFQEALDAVHEHFTESTAFLMPAHITQRIKAARQDATMREPIVQPDLIGRQRLAELTAGAFRAVHASVGEPEDDAGNLVRRLALRRRCPHCNADAGAQCTRSSHNGSVQLSNPHPSRLETQESV